MIRHSPSGPDGIVVHTNLSGTVAALGAAGATDLTTVACPGIAPGDTGWFLSNTLFAAGVVGQPILCLVAGTAICPVIATKAFAGGAVADYTVVVVKS